MFANGEVISYIDMCRQEGASLQRGMNFRLGSSGSVVLMSLRRGAPYADRLEDGGRVLIYEGHDVSQTSRTPSPKTLDQPGRTFTGKPTQNGLFFEAAMRAKRSEAPPEVVRVYEKIRDGIWVFNGEFELVDAWQEVSGKRKVFKFKLQLTIASEMTPQDGADSIPHRRIIPSQVKREVWKRDRGKCVRCGATDNLHFDHLIPFSRGGSSLVAENIQLLCARHNLEKHDKIE